MRAGGITAGIILSNDRRALNLPIAPCPRIRLALAEMRTFNAAQRANRAATHPAHQPITLVHVVKLQAMKGGAYQPVWGASFAFMPHTWKPKAKFHRTLKGARLDLFERPTPSKRARRELWEIGSISTLHGEGYMRATLTSMWADTEASIVDWFSRAENLAGCLKIARDQCLSSEWNYATHFPNPNLVHAFLLAKLGNVEEGKTELAAYCAGREDDASFAELERALGQV